MENELSCPLSCLYLHLLFCAPFFKINVPLVASACEVKLEAEVVRFAFDVRMFDVYDGHETEGKRYTYDSTRVEVNIIKAYSSKKNIYVYLRYRINQ